MIGIQLPNLTDYDPVKSAEGALDPLGLYAIADNLAIKLVPGIRERMSHPRFLTAIAVGAAINRDFDEEFFAADGQSEPYMVYEWHAVEGLFRKRGDDGLRGLPGILKTRNCIKQGLKLSAPRYLKTASVFGFHGVYRLLANNLDIVRDGLLGDNGYELLSTWEREQRLPGFLSGNGGSGSSYRIQIQGAIKDGVHATHFYQLCADILGEDVVFEKEDTEYYDVIIQETLEKLETSEIKYDAILVDEGQDFSADMFRVTIGVLNQTTNNLTIALDENQNLYRKDFSWSDVGIQARGRVHKISYVYRSTQQLSRFAFTFMANTTTEKKAVGHEQQQLFPDFFDFSGPLPEIVQLKDFDAICQYIADKTAETVKKDECPFSEVAVLYAKKTLPDGTSQTVPELIE